MMSVFAFDVWFGNVLLDIRAPWAVEMFKGITFFGDKMTVIGIAGVIAIALWSSKVYRPYVIGLAATLAGAVASVYVLKELVARVRPSGLLPVLTETGFSFPSWHATAAIALYGFIIFLSYKLYPQFRKSITVAGALLIFAIGASRLYLGVHYLSDVLAGFVLGGVWLLAGMWITKKLQKCI